MPGDARPTTFEHAAQARQVLTDAEEDLRDWQPSLDEIRMQSKGMGSNLMPQEQAERVAEEKLAAEGELVASPSSTTHEAEVEKTAVPA